MSMSISAAAGGSGVHTMSGASWSGPPQQKMSQLFTSIDSSGSGHITAAQFNQAFQTANPPAVFQKAGASAIFSALDPNASGSVSKQAFVSGMASLMVSLRAQDASVSAPTPAATTNTAAANVNFTA